MTFAIAAQGPLLLSGRAPDGRHSAQDLSHRVERGELLRVRRGVYIPTAIWTEAQPFQRFGYAVQAVAAQLNQPVFCRETALYLWGLPLHPLPQAVQVRAKDRSVARTVPQPNMTGQSGASSNHFRGFDTRHIAPGRKLEVPSGIPCRFQGTHLLAEPLIFSVLDTVPRLEFGEAVMVLDAVLNGSGSEPPVESKTLETWARSMPWSRAARRRWERALAVSDPLAESPGESLARARILELGFSAAKLQASLTVEGKRYRVDFIWEEAGVVGEFDGWMKYQTEGREALRAEKIREDAIRSLGFTVLRIYWEDLQNPEQLRGKLDRAGVPRI